MFACMNVPSSHVAPLSFLKVVVNVKHVTISKTSKSGGRAHCEAAQLQLHLVLEIGKVLPSQTSVSQRSLTFRREVYGEQEATRALCGQSCSGRGHNRNSDSLRSREPSHRRFGIIFWSLV